MTAPLKYWKMNEAPWFPHQWYLHRPRSLKRKVGRRVSWYKTHVAKVVECKKDTWDFLTYGLLFIAIAPSFSMWHHLRIVKNYSHKLKKKSREKSENAATEKEANLIRKHLQTGQISWVTSAMCFSGEMSQLSCLISAIGTVCIYFAERSLSGVCMKNDRDGLEWKLSSCFSHCASHRDTCVFHPRLNCKKTHPSTLELKPKQLMWPL